MTAFEGFIISFSHRGERPLPARAVFCCNCSIEYAAIGSKVAKVGLVRIV